MKNQTYDTGSVEGGTYQYLVVLGQYGAVLVTTRSGYNLVLLGIKWKWVSTRLLCLYILKSQDLVGCFHSGTPGQTDRQTDRQRQRTRKDRATQQMQWTMDG